MTRLITSLTSASRAKLLVIFCSVVALGAVTASARNWTRADVTEMLPPATEQNTEEESPKVIFLTLRPGGFEPSEVTIPQGTYILVVKNRTGLDEFALRLDRESEGTVHEVRPPKYKRDWKQLHRLTSGGYVMTEVNGLGRSCRIIVTNH